MSRGHQYAENEHERYGNSNKKGKQKISLLSKIGLNKPTKMKNLRCRDTDHNCARLHTQVMEKMEK